MDNQGTSRDKNAAAQHHEEMAVEHDKDDHKLDAEHRDNVMPAHNRETEKLYQEDKAGQ